MTYKKTVILSYLINMFSVIVILFSYNDNKITLISGIILYMLSMVIYADASEKKANKKELSKNHSQAINK